MSWTEFPSVSPKDRKAKPLKIAPQSAPWSSPRPASRRSGATTRPVRLRGGGRINHKPYPNMYPNPNPGPNSVAQLPCSSSFPTRDLGALKNETAQLLLGAAAGKKRVWIKKGVTDLHIPPMSLARGRFSQTSRGSTSRGASWDKKMTGQNNDSCGVF